MRPLPSDPQPYLASRDASSEAVERSPLTIERRWLGRLIIKDVLDFFHNIVRQLRKELQRFDVVVDLVSLRCSEDNLNVVSS